MFAENVFAMLFVAPIQTVSAPSAAIPSSMDLRFSGRSPFFSPFRSISRPMVSDRERRRHQQRDSASKSCRCLASNSADLRGRRTLPPERRKRDLEDFQIGEEVEAKVLRWVPFGAFLDIGAKTDALLHNSQIPKEFNADASKKLAVGQIFKCYIKETNAEKQRIGLTLRKTLDAFKVGDRIEGKVTRVTPFGGFVDIGSVSDALLHVSEITDEFIDDASKILKPGEHIKCRIIEIDTWKQRIGVTCKHHVIVEPKQHPCSSAVVWLHGYSEGPGSWEEQFQKVIELHPAWKWVFLRAPKVAQSHRKGRRVPAWGNYYEEDCTRVGSVDYDNVDLVSEATIREVHRVIDELQKHDNVPASRIMVGGYSMGAAAAAAVALTYPGQIAGIVILSGWLVPAARKALREFPPSGLPVFVSHGTEDEWVGFDCGEEAAKLLQDSGASVEFVTHEGLHHHDAYTVGKEAAAKFMDTVLVPPLNS